MAEQTTTTLHQHFTDVTKNGNTRHSFPAEDGRKYTTFKADVAAKAVALLGQPARVTFDVKQNGQYTNIYLEGVEPVNGSAPGAASAPEQAGSVTSDPRQASIQRQVALKAAVELAANGVIDPAILEQTADRLLGWIEGNG